ncbi:unnamed protein product [Vitrella brassicaformis CCMP3155]|uniref:Uncharacterized protein n=1 Tax=Vitrella brassicaformis (strain CCMP3155) TaxID=1169540 RepID=A0A0G4EYX6_VITBC|nr:unnamed protein product [Vitrella brassicaformis CCMP3155]|mmetsp:Transcript_17343/g.41693  ORF Transcript_17343/g.41693 Transcript_17343/m.41693 type:complete len:288 (-) Transcript_17343:1083-1946(-)|eukprot:CEM04156.1 unnamed protein product [Vitrella brassicaformis CCMP3155]
MESSKLRRLVKSLALKGLIHAASDSDIDTFENILKLPQFAHWKQAFDLYVDDCERAGKELDEAHALTVGEQTAPVRRVRHALYIAHLCGVDKPEDLSEDKFAIARRVSGIERQVSKKWERRVQDHVKGNKYLRASESPTNIRGIQALHLIPDVPAPTRSPTKCQEMLRSLEQQGLLPHLTQEEERVFLDALCTRFDDWKGMFREAVETANKEGKPLDLKQQIAIDDKMSLPLGKLRLALYVGVTDSYMQADEDAMPFEIKKVVSGIEGQVSEKWEHRLIQNVRAFNV